MSDIEIPESSYPALQTLTRLTPEEFETLLTALARAQPAGRPHLFWKHVAEHAPNIKRSTVKDIVRELFALTSFKEDSDVPDADFAKSIADSAVAQHPEDSPFERTDGDLLQERLTRFFELRTSLGLTAKAWDLLTDAQSLFYSSKILTDMRPVFNAEGTAAEAAVIVHNLRIHYGDCNVHKNFFVTLDSNDLQQLRSVLDRAEQKAESLKSLLKRSELRYLDVEEE